jgi:anti-anti-sigma regulatory factor
VKIPAQLQLNEAIEGGRRILSLGGSADILCLPILQDLFARYTREDVRSLLIDLSATKFINSPVWAVITLFARRQPEIRRVAIVGMPERIRGSFEMMGLQRELQTFQTLAEAHAAWNETGAK